MAPKTRTEIKKKKSPSNIITYGAIKNKLVNEKTPRSKLTDAQMQERAKAHCEPFMPKKVLESFIQEDKVKATLDGLLGIREYNEELARYVIDRASKAFLTTVYIQARHDMHGDPCMKLLREAEFTDRSLPVHTIMVEDDEDEEELYEVCAHRSKSSLECFSEWDAMFKANFERDQWIFLAPTFKERYFSYDFHQNERMPFVYIPNPNPAGGFFGKVLKLGLRLDHLRIDQRKYQLKSRPDEEHVEIAVKFMTTDINVPNSDVDKFYDREKDTLERMRGLNDNHLIRAIAAYKKGAARCFIFPWAEGGNLDTFWRNDRSALDRSLVLWAIDQMTGIVGGIMKLHGVHAEGTRHGDIKPYNILYFLDKVDGCRGTLKVADVGLAKVHHEYTKYRDATTTRMSTERYEPPEMMSYVRGGTAIPRVYDSWSLGCVFFEFILWLVHGYAKLRDLYRNLKQSNDERFYEKKGESNPRHHIVDDLINGMEVKLPVGTALGELLRLISQHLLVPVHKRMDTKALHGKLDRIRDECRKRSSYCFDSSLVKLARNRPIPSDDTDNNPQPPDNHTSKLDNRWRSTPDSEWARFLISRIDFPSLRPPSEMGICDACSSVDFLGDDVDLGRTLNDFKETSEDCSMCSFLYDCFSAASTGIVDQSQEFLSLSMNSPPAISFYVDPDHKGPAPPQAQLGLPILPKLGSPQEFALLNEWVTLCDRAHDCVSGELNTEFLGQTPTRLIDVGTVDAPSLHLVETAHEDITAKYLALSHCWGKLSKEARFCTYSDNIQDLKQHIPFEKLPQTFKDAVTVTRALNVRYLWIDSLCIIQEDPEDWNIEAARMEDVFKSAYCTIAASSASSSLEGFLGCRKERAVIGISTSKGPFYLAENIDDFHKDVEQGILNTRGWVFQERALSRRTIHFTSTQVYWECGHGVHCETLAHLRNRKSDLLGDSKFPNYGLQKYKDDSIRLVQFLYQTYSGLNLTNTTDRSKALLGLEQRLGRTFQSQAEHGILSAYFDRLLLWQRDQRLPLDNIPYPDGDAVPSWSWMTLMGKISYLDVPFGKVNWTGDVASPFSTQADQDDVPWDGGIQAMAHELSIEENDLKDRVRTDLTYTRMDPKDFKCVVVGTSKLTNDDGIADQYVLLIQQRSPGVYKRIGVGTLLSFHVRPETESVYII